MMHKIKIRQQRHGKTKEIKVELQKDSAHTESRWHFSLNCMQRKMKYEFLRCSTFIILEMAMSNWSLLSQLPCLRHVVICECEALQKVQSIYI